MRLSIRDLVRISLFTALHIAAAWLLRLGGEAIVPFSLVPLLVLLSGLLLGRKGALSLVLYALLGLAGLPVFAKPPFGGLAYLLQPSFGFVLGYILAAAVAGWLLERWPGGGLGLMAVAALAGLGALYLCGLPYLYWAVRLLAGKRLAWQQLLLIGFWPFIGFDLVKAGVAVWLASLVQRRLPTAAGAARTPAGQAKGAD